MTILGQHTIAELKDLVKAKDYQVTQVQKAAAAFDADWKRNDPLVRDRWVADWLAFVARYRAARAKADDAIESAKGVFAVREDVNPAEKVYQGVLDALKPAEAYTETDFQGLHNRLVAAQKKPVPFTSNPQPKANDPDLNAYKAVDDTAKAVERAAKDVVTSKTFLLGSLVGLGFLYVAVKGR